jgi:hypothetical protein
MNRILTRQPAAIGAQRTRPGLSVHDLPLLVALTLFLALCAPQLTLPGLHYDEAREAGVNAMQLVTGQPLTAFRDAFLQLGPWRLPLMVQDYIGALNVALAMPLLALGGVNVPSLRWLSVLVGAFTLVLTWRVALRLSGATAAAIASLLLAVNPTFIFWSRQGIFVTNLTALLFVASLLTGLRWWEGRRPLDLWLTAFLWGLGIYAKLLFIWAVIAMAIAGGIAWVIDARRRGGEAASRDHERAAEVKPFAGRASLLRTWIIAAGCFCLPLIPLIVFNLQTGGTLASVFGSLSRSYYGVDNRAYLPNLAIRLGQLRILLRGDHLWYLGEVYANRWAPLLAAGLAAVWTAVWLWRCILGPARRWASLAPLLPVALLALIVAQSAFTVSDLFITHSALLAPLIPLSVGVLAGDLLRQIGERRADEKASVRGLALLSMLCLAPVIVWGATDLANAVRYHRVLALSGGYGAHSDAIYRLADFLAAQGPSAPLALDWGIDAPVRYLTGGRANPIEAFGYERLDAPDPGFADRVRPFMDNPDNLYVAHAGEFTVFRGRLEALAASAAERGMNLQEVARFTERSGRPLFLVYRVSKAR